MKPVVFIAFVLLAYVAVGFYQLVEMAFEHWRHRDAFKEDGELARMLAALEEKLGSRRRVVVAMVFVTIFFWPFYLKEGES